ncbi:MAG: Bug family tripartite tricarboxylate transporter substrate binding protein [Xanthobacteraceae bacterium]
MTRTLVSLASAIAWMLTAAPAFAQADFYKGKTVTIIVGTRVGGTIGNTALLVSRHMGKYIPGNPTVILRQMPGGAHMNATNHVYNVAEPDGLTILAANPAIAMGELAKVKQIRFSVTKFQWLGSTGPDGAVFAIRSTLPYKSFKEIQNAKQELVVGTTGPGSNSHDIPLLLKEFAGAKLKLLAGYAANGDIRLALERREADGWSALATTIRLESEKGTVRPIVRSGRRAKGLEHIPLDEDLTTSKLGKSLMRIRSAPLSIGKPFAVRPGVPADRVAILRAAFAKAVGDPQFLADAKKQMLVIDPIDAKEVTHDFNEMMGQPPESITALQKYIKIGEPKKKKK